MAYPSVTYTFTNGTVASGPNVSTNFSDIIAGLSDGSKDISVAAITAAGTATFNGAVNLGNATGDDITVTGYVASNVIPKTTNTYDLGTTSLRWKDIWAAGNLAVTGTLSAAGKVTATDTTDSTSTSTGALVVSGGLGVAKSAKIGAANKVLNISPSWITGNYAALGGIGSASQRITLSAGGTASIQLAAGGNGGGLIILQGENGTGAVIFGHYSNSVKIITTSGGLGTSTDYVAGAPGTNQIGVTHSNTNTTTTFTAGAGVTDTYLYVLVLGAVF